MSDKELIELLNNGKSLSEVCLKLYGRAIYCDRLKLKKEIKRLGYNWDNHIKDVKKANERHCLLCGKLLNKDQKKFCSSSCSAKHNNKGRVYKYNAETSKKISESLKKYWSSNTEKVCVNEKFKYKNDIYRRKNITIYDLPCRLCGEMCCKHPEICGDKAKSLYKIEQFKRLSNYFGLDSSKIGTSKIYGEYYRIRELVYKEYWDNGLSLTDIQNKYNFENKSISRISKLFETLKITTRGFSESVRNSILNGKLLNSSYAHNYKTGYHTTWDGKEYFFRSSYEEKYMVELDKNKIKYEYEKIRIKYWDSQVQAFRVAIPDFYLNDSNKIVEIKSLWTFDKQNMIDKCNEYIKLGYDVTLILEFKEYSFEDIYNL